MIDYKEMKSSLATRYMDGNLSDESFHSSMVEYDIRQERLRRADSKVYTPLEMAELCRKMSKRTQPCFGRQ